MSCEEYGGSDKHLETTIKIGVEELRHNSTAAVVDYVEAQHFEGAVSDRFKADAFFGIARKGLWDETIDADKALPLLDKLSTIDQSPTNVSWGNDVANLGKYLAREEQFVERGQAVLRKAAGIFERDYGLVSDQSLHERAQFLIEDYCRVAGLQDEAGDSTGGRQTSQIIAPHLVALTKELNQDEAAYDRNVLESQLNSTIHSLGDLDSEEARYLFRNIRNENMRHITLGVLLENTVGDLVAVGEVERALSFLKAGDGTPMSVWSEAAALWRNGEQQTVHELIDKVGEVFPGFYEKGDAVVTGMTPMVEILGVANRDDLLQTVFKGMIAADEDMTAMHRFAYRCGFNSEGQRLQTITKPLDMQRELTTKVYESYQMGVDAVAKQTETAQV